ncbi:MAG: putative membrane protein [Candidatus Saccharimonadales bacterium]|jgi:uncharacterized membrane protein
MVYLVATTAASLTARNYAKQTNINPLLSSLPTNLFVALPLAIAYFLATNSFVVPDPKFWAFIAVEGTCGVAYGYMSMYAQKHSDASTYATLLKSHVLIILLVSSIFLGESLSLIQLGGVGILLLSGLLLSKSIHKTGLRYILMSIVLLSGVVIFGRLAVLTSNVGTSILAANMLGLTLKLGLVGRQIPSSIALLRADFPQRVKLSIIVWIQVIAFTLSVDVSGNVGLISSLASVKVVTVMMASYIFLNERDNLLRKVIATILGFTALILLGI